MFLSKIEFAEPYYTIAFNYITRLISISNCKFIGIKKRYALRKSEYQKKDFFRPRGRYYHKKIPDRVSRYKRKLEDYRDWPGTDTRALYYRSETGIFLPSELFNLKTKYVIYDQRGIFKYEATDIEFFLQN